MLRKSELRKAVNRFKEAGYTIQYHRGPKLYSVVEHYNVELYTADDLINFIRKCLGRTNEL